MKTLNVQKTLIKVLALGLFILPLSSHAVLMEYTFEGIITDFRSFNEDYSIDDFAVELGKTEVQYVFHADLDKVTRTHTNPGGTWQYFDAELISGSGIHDEHYQPTANTFNWIDSRVERGVMADTGVSISTTEFITDSWNLQDWSIGQAFTLQDMACYPRSGSGCAVLFYGDVNLTSVTPVPLPASLLFFLSGLAGIAALRRRANRLTA